MSRFSPKLQRLWFFIRHPGFALVILMSTPMPSRAQSASGSAGTVETNTVQLIQYGVDVIIAMSGGFAIYLGFRAARTLVAASREGGRGDNKGHHVMADLGGAAIAVSVGTIVYIVSNQLFNGITSSPTLTAPSITPSTSSG